MIEALTSQAVPPRETSPVLLMVSGGSDSTALLVRAARGELDLADGRGPRRIERGCLAVLHVNHCLRGAASDGDEEFVRRLSGELGVAFRVARADVGALVAAGRNLEEAAREVRYRAAWDLLAELAAAAGVPAASGRVLVAHTADDRAETFLMRALFGGGLGALTGMRACRGVVVRPLLGETRATLRAYLAEQGVGWREDATNADEEALRSYVRRRVVPPLVARNPRFARTLGSALDLLSDEDDLLGRMADELLERALRAREPGAVELDVAVLAAAERPLARRTVRAALELAWGPDGFERARPNAAHVETVLDLVTAGGGSATLPLGLDARVGAGVLSLALPPASPDADAALRPGESLAWGGWELACREHRLERPGSAFERARAIAGERAASGLREGRDFVLVDAAVAGAGGELWVGAPRSGERMRPFGMEGSKLLSDVVREAGVARHARGRVPVVRGADGNVVWVGGFRLDARAAYGGATRVLLELSARPAAAPQPGSGA